MKEREAERKISNRKNIFLLVFILIYVIGYFLFFTSNIWYPSSDNLVAATTIGSVKNWNNRDITLLSWTYSEKQHLMEVQIEILNRSLDGNNQYSFEVLDRDHGYLAVTPVVVSDDFVVLHIDGIHRNWSELSLRIKLSNDESASASDSSELKLYTNSNAIAAVDQIEDKTFSQYQIERCELHIDEYNKKIDELKTLISDHKLNISSQESDIADLQEQEQFQTQEQINETENIISSAKNNINSLNQEITAAEKQIDEFSNRIEKLMKQIESYSD